MLIGKGLPNYLKDLSFSEPWRAQYETRLEKVLDTLANQIKS